MHERGQIAIQPSALSMSHVQQKRLLDADPCIYDKQLVTFFLTLSLFSFVRRHKLHLFHFFSIHTIPHLVLYLTPQWS